MAFAMDTPRTVRVGHLNGEQSKQNTLTKGAVRDHVTLDILSMGLTFVILDAP